MQRRPLVHAVALALVLDVPARMPHPFPGLRPFRMVADGGARPPGAGRPPEDTPVAFRLSDQFGDTHDAADYRGRPFVLVGAGRHGRDAGTAWVQALRGLQGDSAAPAPLPVIAVADLRGVPRLLRRVVRGGFPDDRRQAVLLDWEGTLARQLHFDERQSTVVVVAPSGHVHSITASAAVDSARARTILREAQALTTTAFADPRR